MISPLALAGAALVTIISPDSPLPITIVVALFVAALCYVLARITDDIKASHQALAEEAARHREALAKQLYGAICHEALSWIGAHGHQVDRWEAAAQILDKTYGSTAETSAPPGDVPRLRAVADLGRDRRISPSA